MLRRIGIIGYGYLGRFLVDYILQQFDLELSFVWCYNNSILVGQIDCKYILDDLAQFHTRQTDLIIDVSTPEIAKRYGAQFLKKADYMLLSAACLVNPEVETSLRAAAVEHGLYIPAGALWGGADIQRMADQRTLQTMKITLKKQPTNFHLEGELESVNSKVSVDPVVLYSGNMRELYSLAPNDVNSVLIAAVVAHNLGFDRVESSLISDPSLKDEQVVEVEVWGQTDTEKGTRFHCKSVTVTPVLPSDDKETDICNSFLKSMLDAHGKGPGIHLC